MQRYKPPILPSPIPVFYSLEYFDRNNLKILFNNLRNLNAVKSSDFSNNYSIAVYPYFDPRAFSTRRRRPAGVENPAEERSRSVTGRKTARERKREKKSGLVRRPGETIGDGVRLAMEGRGGWLSAGSKGGARSSFRGTGRGWTGNGAREVNDRVVGVVVGGSNGAGRPEVGGWRCSWVEATTSKSDFRSTCYASGSLPLRHPSSLYISFMHKS